MRLDENVKTERFSSFFNTFPVFQVLHLVTCFGTFGAFLLENYQLLLLRNGPILLFLTFSHMCTVPEVDVHIKHCKRVQ